MFYHIGVAEKLGTGVSKGKEALHDQAVMVG